MSAPNPLDVPDATEPYQPRSGRRGSGFLTEPFQLGTTPSATVGPYLAIGLTWADGIWAAAEGTEGGFWIRGRVFDGNGDVVPDAMIETWQADPDGRFPAPGDPPARPQAPLIDRAATRRDATRRVRGLSAVGALERIPVREAHRDRAGPCPGSPGLGSGARSYHRPTR